MFMLALLSFRQQHDSRVQVASRALVSQVPIETVSKLITLIAQVPIETVSKLITLITQVPIETVSQTNNSVHTGFHRKSHYRKSTNSDSSVPQRLSVN